MENASGFITRAVDRLAVQVPVAPLGAAGGGWLRYRLPCWPLRYRSIRCGTSFDIVQFR